MRYSVQEILKVPKDILVKKSHTLTQVEYLKWQLERIQQVIDEDMSHAGPEKWNSYNLSKLNYRHKCMKFWQKNLDEVTID